jgi:hypothetical protein
LRFTRAWSGLATACGCRAWPATALGCTRQARAEVLAITPGCSPHSWSSLASRFLAISSRDRRTWRVCPGHTALTRLPAIPRFPAPLSFVRFEPYVLPKRSLTGDTIDQVGTRLLQAIYEFAPSQFPGGRRSAGRRLHRRLRPSRLQRSYRRPGADLRRSEQGVLASQAGKTFQLDGPPTLVFAL